ncbi:hypothetical protein [Labrys miyagiensis]|nr:hypothetical protein [Labrys miyagiensis]
MAKDKEQPTGSKAPSIAGIILGSGFVSNVGRAMLGFLVVMAAIAFRVPSESEMSLAYLVSGVVCFLVTVCGLYSLKFPDHSHLDPKGLATVLAKQHALKGGKTIEAKAEKNVPPPNAIEDKEVIVPKPAILPPNVSPDA